MKILILILLVGSALAATSFKGHLRRHTKNIGSLLEDILGEPEVKAVLPWLKELMPHASKMQWLIKYLNTDKYDAITDYLRKCPGYSEMKIQLEAEGVDLPEASNKIRNLITILFNSKKIEPREENEIHNEVPMRAVQIVKDKLKNNRDAAKKLEELIKGDLMKATLECMKKSPEIQEIIDQGIDILYVVEFAKSLLPSGTIGALLENLIQELGIRDVLPWVREMIDSDPDIQKIVEYLKSDAYKRIEDHLRHCPGYLATKDELNAEGVDLVDIVEAIRNFLIGGPSRYRSYKIQARRTLAELLDEVVEKLDVNKMINTIHDKFYNDPALRKVIDFLKSQTFIDINLCMKENPDVQDLIQKLREEGIDVDSLIEMIKTLLSGGHD